METQIKILNSKGVYNTYTIKNRTHLNAESMQAVLKDNKSIEDKKDTVFCGCKGFQNPLRLSNKIYHSRDGKNKYTLAILKNSVEHSSLCPFYSGNRNLTEIIEGEIVYKTSIFSKINIDNNASSQELKFEKSKSNVFHSFGEDVISRTNIEMFKFLENKKSKKYTYKNFFKFFYQKLKEVKISKYENIIKYAQKTKGLYFEYGFIQSSISINNIKNLEKTADIDLELFTYEYDELKRINFLKAKKKKINDIIIKISSDNIHIIEKDINPPYFYIALYDKTEIIKISLFPIYFNTSENIISFVDSNIEREYVEELVFKNTFYLKPITGFEFKHIYPHFPFIKYIPTVIEIHSDFMEMVDLEKESDSKKLEIEEETLKYFENLHNKNKNIKYSKKTFDNMFGCSSEWDGTQIVGFGIKNFNKKWIDISDYSLGYYMCNYNKDIKQKAYMEYRRRLTIKRRKQNNDCKN